MHVAPGGHQRQAYEDEVDPELPLKACDDDLQRQHEEDRIEVIEDGQHLIGRSL